jgi:hypothetical protein
MARKRETRQALASQSADRLKAVAAQMKPFARSTKAAAARGVHATRTWGAPRVERAGQVLQDSVAPKAASVLSSAAHRLDPGKPRDARWRTRAGIATVTAAASAAAALVFRRRKPRAAPSPAEPENDAATAESGDTRATAGTDADGQRGAS